MTWDAVGAIGEIVGALAVLITLLYLASQIKQVKKDLHVSGYREINKLYMDTSSSVTAEIAQIIAKLEIEEELEPWESILRDEYYFRIMTTLEVAWEHLRAGAIEVDNEDALSTIRAYLQKPGYEEWWERHRPGFLAHWQEIVDLCFDTMNQENN